MSLIEFAKKELDLIGYKENEEDGPNKWMRDGILEMVEVFAKQGHSGSSAPYAVRLLSKLLKFDPLSPLTGEDDEWMEISDNLYQNKRCFHVFKENGVAYDSEGIIFELPDGARFINKDSRVTVFFPYTPKTEIVKVDE